MEGGWKTPPQCYNETKKPSAYRVKGHAKSYGIELQDNLNPLNHFTKTRALIESHLENLLKDMKKGSNSLKHWR